MMKDGKALQSGTSHYFGDKFSKAYDVTFTGRDNQLYHPFQTSWAFTRLRVRSSRPTATTFASSCPGRRPRSGRGGSSLPKARRFKKAAELARRSSKYPRQAGRQRQRPRLEVPVGDEGRAPAPRDRSKDLGEEPVRPRPPRHPREGVRLSGRAGDRHPGPAGGPSKDLYERASRQPCFTGLATTMDEVKELAKVNTGYITPCGAAIWLCETKISKEFACPAVVCPSSRSI